MLAIFKRELRSCFHGMIGAVLTAFMLAATAIYFVALNLGYGLPDFGYYTLYRTIFVLLLYIPVLTMRSFAEERHSRTDQLLLTSPVSVGGIVLGKYFALPCGCGHDPCAEGAGRYRHQHAGQLFCPAVLLPHGLRRHCHRGVPFQPDRKPDHRRRIRCGSAAAGLYDAQSAHHVYHRQRGGAGTVYRYCRRAQRGGGAAQQKLYAGLPFLCGVLRGAYGAVSAQAFSAVLSALCLFTPFEEFVNSSFSIPTLVYYLTVAAVFLFFTAQGLEKRRWN